jgi:hypothetical protein
MELQTQIDELKAKVAQLEALLNGGNPKFGIITCDGWQVVDKDGKERIDASTDAYGHAYVVWYDQEGKVRIAASTLAYGEASVKWFDKDGCGRITAATYFDGTVVLPTSDRIGRD